MSRPRRFTEDDVAVMRHQHNAGTTYREIGRRHGVSGDHIRKLVLGVHTQQRRERAPSRKSDPALLAFVDALRACLDKDPLYNKKPRPEIERFYIEPHVDRAQLYG